MVWLFVVVFAVGVHCCVLLLLSVVCCCWLVVACRVWLSLIACRRLLGDWVLLFVACLLLVFVAVYACMWCSCVVVVSCMLLLCCRLSLSVVVGPCLLLFVAVGGGYLCSLLICFLWDVSFYALLVCVFWCPMVLLVVRRVLCDVCCWCFVLLVSVVSVSSSCLLFGFVVVCG